MANSPLVVLCCVVLYHVKTWKELRKAVSNRKELEHLNVDGRGDGRQEKHRAARRVNFTEADYWFVDLPYQQT